MTDINPFVVGTIVLVLVSIISGLVGLGYYRKKCRDAAECQTNKNIYYGLFAGTFTILLSILLFWAVYAYKNKK